MKLSIRFHSEADAELVEEMRYYANISPDLAQSFVKSIEAVVALATEFPGVGAPYKYRTRRVFPQQFPFSIVYLERNDEIFIVAIAPFARKPGYWKERLNTSA